MKAALLLMLCLLFPVTGRAQGPALIQTAPTAPPGIVSGLPIQHTEVSVELINIPKAPKLVGKTSTWERYNQLEASSQDFDELRNVNPFFGLVRKGKGMAKRRMGSISIQMKWWSWGLSKDKNYSKDFRITPVVVFGPRKVGFGFSFSWKRSL